MRKATTVVNLPETPKANKDKNSPVGTFGHTPSSYKRKGSGSRAERNSSAQSSGKLNSIRKNIEDKISSIRDSFSSPQLAKELDDLK